ARLALQAIYELNVLEFEDGKRGAVNGMRPEGLVDPGFMQAGEVWPGTTYALAATMIREGMTTEGFATAQGAAESTYGDFGYWFQTPEAWTYLGDYRSLGYMRPLAIWAIQQAWEERKT
ncbi:MAG: glucosylceramidase, partial [Anaerolineae bacterium]|nr:glucosylceramidase [Anaerolineae bacterium]